MKGFLQPVTPELFAYFWNQGWPKELLLHVFVLEAEVTKVKNGTVTTDHLFNHPRFESPDNKDYRDFAAWVTGLISGDSLSDPRFRGNRSCRDRHRPTSEAR